MKKSIFYIYNTITGMAGLFCGLFIAQSFQVPVVYRKFIVIGFIILVIARTIFESKIINTLNNK